MFSHTQLIVDTSVDLAGLPGLLLTELRARFCPRLAELLRRL
jgi:hypothetical protein